MVPVVSGAVKSTTSCSSVDGDNSVITSYDNGGCGGESSIDSRGQPSPLSAVCDVPPVKTTTTTATKAATITRSSGGTMSVVPTTTTTTTATTTTTTTTKSTSTARSNGTTTTTTAAIVNNGDCSEDDDAPLKMGAAKKPRKDPFQNRNVNWRKAIVRPQVLEHYIEGFLIKEGPEPFPVSTELSHLTVTVIIIIIIIFIIC